MAIVLPDDAPARLTAFDLTGRRIAVREVAGKGAHTMTLGSPRSGVYFLRLEQGKAAVQARAVVLSGGP